MDSNKLLYIRARINNKIVSDQVMKQSEWFEIISQKEKNTNKLSEVKNINNTNNKNNISYYVFDHPPTNFDPSRVLNETGSLKPILHL